MMLQSSAGLILESDFLLSQANLNNLNIRLINQKQITYKYNQELLAILDINQNYIINIDFDFYNTLPSKIDYYNIGKLANRRLEYQNLNLLYRSQKLQYNKQKFGLLLPNISIGINDGTLGIINEDPIGNQNVINASLMWKIPISRLYPAGEYKKQRSLLNMKDFKKEDLINKLISEMRTLISDLSLANQQLEYSQESVKLTQKAYNHSLQRQKLGTANQLELFHAEKEYINAQLIHIESLLIMHKLTFKRQSIFHDKLLQ